LHDNLDSDIEIHKTKQNDTWYLNCHKPVNDIFPPLVIQLNEHLYTLPASMYIIQDSGACYHRIGVSKDNFWTLGIAFLQGFYQVYDMKRNQVGLVP
jgi:Eukaryotic aspartyl protease